MKSLFKKSWLLRGALNCWPPLFFAGIRVEHLSPDYREARVRLKLRPWNKNAVGTHFGGSLSAMTDPFYMLMIMAVLGEEYLVWDKSADIEFVKPGKGIVVADFVISDGLIEDIIEKTAQGEKYLPSLPVYIKDQQGEIVAKVNRTIYIRRKQRSIT
jgi:acyl-coenzyme A thioesterase PaaI-like protein